MLLKILARRSSSKSWSTKALHHKTTTEVQLAKASYDSNNYFASSMNSHVDVASHNHTRYVASANTFDNAPHHTHRNYGYYDQEPMHVVNSSVLMLLATYNI
jgi:hypothetical protein